MSEREMSAIAQRKSPQDASLQILLTRTVSETARMPLPAQETE